MKKRNLKKPHFTKALKIKLLSIVAILLVVLTFTASTVEASSGSWVNELGIYKIVDYINGFFESGSRYGKGDFIDGANIDGGEVVVDTHQSLNTAVRVMFDEMTDTSSYNIYRYKNGQPDGHREVYKDEHVYPFAFYDYPMYGLRAGNTYTYFVESIQTGETTALSNEMNYEYGKPYNVDVESDSQNMNIGISFSYSAYTEVNPNYPVEYHLERYKSNSMDGDYTFDAEFIFDSSDFDLDWQNNTQSSWNINRIEQEDEGLVDGYFYAYRSRFNIDNVYSDYSDFVYSGEYYGAPVPLDTPDKPFVRFENGSVEIFGSAPDGHNYPEFTAYTVIRFKEQSTECGTDIGNGSYYCEDQRFEGQAFDEDWEFSTVQSEDQGLENETSYKYAFVAKQSYYSDSDMSPLSEAVTFYEMPEIPNQLYFTETFNQFRVGLTKSINHDIVSSYELVRYKGQNDSCRSDLFSLFNFIDRANASSEYFCKEKVEFLDPELFEQDGPIYYYDNDNLIHGAEYYYQMQAHNNMLHSGFSEESDHIEYLRTVAAVQFTDISLGVNEMNIEWEPSVTDVTGYELSKYRLVENEDDCANPLGSLPNTSLIACDEEVYTLADTTSYSDKGTFVDSAYYQYKIVALYNNHRSNATYSGENTFITTPEAPGPVSLSQGENKIRVEWENSANDVDLSVVFQWERLLEYEGQCAEQVSVGENLYCIDRTSGYSMSEQQLIDWFGLINAKNYTYRVKAIHGYHDSEWAYSEPLSYKSTPNAPVIEGATLGRDMITVSWLPTSDNTTGYKLLRYKESRGSVGSECLEADGSRYCPDDIEKVIDGEENTSFSDYLGLSNNIKYLYRVAAMNGTQVSSYGDPSISLNFFSVPDEPTINNIEVNGNAISLEWDEQDNVTSFELKRYIGQNTSCKDGDDNLSWLSRFFQIASADSLYYCHEKTVDLESGTTTYVDYEDLINGTEYRYHLKAVNHSQRSSEHESDDVIFYVVPESPVMNNVNVMDNETIEIDWLPSSEDITGYSLIRYKGQKTECSEGNGGTIDGIFYCEDATIQLSNITSFSDIGGRTGFVDGADYSYRVQALNNGQDSELSSFSKVATYHSGLSAPEAPMGTQNKPIAESLEVLKKGNAMTKPSVAKPAVGKSVNVLKK